MKCNFSNKNRLILIQGSIRIDVSNTVITKEMILNTFTVYFSTEVPIIQCNRAVSCEYTKIIFLHREVFSIIQSISMSMFKLLKSQLLYYKVVQPIYIQNYYMSDEIESELRNMLTTQ